MTQTLRRLGVSGLLLYLALVPAARADEIVADDQIVVGGLCAGLDCADGESFGQSITAKLKADDTGLLFEDTSLAPFAGTNWLLQANDTDAGGLNAFYLKNVTAGTEPFSVAGAAPSHSLHVANTGNLGIGTDNPALRLSLKRNDTPGVRLEQDNTGGFSPQTWDVAGNEANFFVRDLTHGSTLPFRIRPGAPTSSIDIGATGDVSTGTLLQNVGNLTITGPTNGEAILAALRGLTLSRYTRNNDSAAAPHVGPTGTAFRAAFGTGNDNNLLATADTAGIALAAVKALDARVSALALTPGPKGADGAPGAGVADPRVAALVTSNRKLGTANRRLSRHLAALKEQVKALAAAQR